MTSIHRLAYVTRHVYPDLSAAAGQSIQMAAALARLVENADYYVHDLKMPELSLRAQYPGVSDSPLRIRNLHLTRPPRHLLHNNAMSRFITYNSLVALHLLGRRGGGTNSAPKNILFVRSRLEITYWGLLRPYLFWLRNWVFVCEMHDDSGIKPHESSDASAAEKPTNSVERRRRALRALSQYDLVLCINQALADDLKQWSNGSLQPSVVRLSSATPRVAQPPAVSFSNDRVVLGYVGTIDRYRGVDKLLMAMRHLPQNYLLRLVGRVPERSDRGHGPDWLDDLLGDPDIKSRVELRPPVPVTLVAEEIDRCDIVLQPASSDTVASKYASPLKSYDYMARGKPILAADVASHKELFQDGVNARLYRHDDVQHLAACIKSLVEQPKLMEAMARAAWAQSAEYNYSARAKRILSLVDEVRENRRMRPSASH